jgi:dUTP pyrophosphatase
MASNSVRIHLLPGGKMPERKTKGAIGFDAAIRAVVSATEMDPINPILRKTLFDFSEVPKDNPYTERHVVIVPGQAGNQLAYQMDPGESVLVGIGFITEMEFPMFYWAAPRSGLAAKWGITVTNSPGTVDPDYRGEAGVLVYNKNPHPFLLHKDMRIAQVIFQRAIIPNFDMVDSYKDLSNTSRGTGGFGSTGIK